jgi:hypothetical protein
LILILEKKSKLLDKLKIKFFMELMMVQFNRNSVKIKRRNDKLIINKYFKNINNN